MEQFKAVSPSESCNPYTRATSPEWTGLFAWMRGHQLVWLIIALCLPTVGQASDSYGDVVRNHLALETQDPSDAISAQDVGEVELQNSDLAMLLRMEAQAITEVSEVAPPPAGKTGPKHTLVLSVALLFVGVMALGIFARTLFARLNEKFKLLALGSAHETSFLKTILAEDESFSAFLPEFKTGPSALSGISPFPVIASVGSDPLREFFDATPALVAEMRKLLQEIGRATDELTRQEKFKELRGHLCNLKGDAGLPGLLPMWQMAFALEGLVKQLTDKPCNVTPSTLRSVAGGVDLLQDMCKPGLKPDLLTSPPLKFLAVDDDIICRNAVSLALKKAFNPPDLAANGADGLTLTVEQLYDVIFVDVQMPGMDGYELCTKIHETVLNSITPVVFVTGMGDFNSRAESTLSGGSDLIGKPFLSFEITVKALTLALRRRLQGQAQIVTTFAATKESTFFPKATADAGLKNIIANMAMPSSGDAPSIHIVPVLNRNTENREVSQSLVELSSEVNRGVFTTITMDSHRVWSNDKIDKFLSHAAPNIVALRNQIQSACQTSDDAARQQILAKAYLRLHSFTQQLDHVTAHPAKQLSDALQGLLRKLMENSRNSTQATLLTVVAGLDLLTDLCLSRTTSDWIARPPARLLVVDDDPLARRAVVCALQMVFEKPESVSSGKEALALASQYSYDVIFLDVMMPGMDGFATCENIRTTSLNIDTPVVFVTSQIDFKTRAKISLCGGSDFLGKPFLNSEIIVKTLTFVLRRRLLKIQTDTSRKLPCPA